ncbi:MAG: hypothetical protein AAFZ07_00010 [Actinomycetota bacterium]
MTAPAPIDRDARTEHEDPPALLFWPAALLGAAIVAYGLVRWAPWDSRSIDLGTYLRWTVGLAVVHDLIFAPIVGLIGYGIARVVPRTYRATVQGSAIVAGITILFSIPFVRGWGRNSNTSALPRNYAEGLTIILVLIGVVTVALLIRDHLRAKATERTDR